MQIEYLGQPPARVGGRRTRLLWMAALGLGGALLLALLILLAVAYARQTERVDDLQTQNESILSDHETIGQQFAQQSQQFTEEARKLEQAVQSAYDRGYRAGRETASLPAPLRSLGGHAAAGVLVPRSVPADAGRARLQRGLNGYTIRWRRLAVFASRLEPLENWTRQALGGRRSMTVGPHRVQRLLGPGGVVYAWRRGGVTYAVIAVPAEEPAARALIAAMR